MTGKIASAIQSAGIGVITDRIKVAANNPVLGTERNAMLAAQEAVSAVVQSGAVRDAIAAATPTPIAWYKSQALWGAIVAATPTLVMLIGRYFGVEFTEGEAAEIVSQISAVVGGLVAFYGRVTTTRPIAGTEAASKVASRV